MADDILDLPGETWKPDIISGADHILVSSLGRVKTIAREVPHGTGGGVRKLRAHIVPAYPIKGAHLAVHIHAAGATANQYVHRLVCGAFHGPPPPDKPLACHWNGNGFDNRPENIRWDTGSENMLDKRLHGTDVRGSNAPWTDLTEDDVLAIREQVAAGAVQRDVARTYGQTPANIWAIVHRKSWAHI